VRNKFACTSLDGTCWGLPPTGCPPVTTANANQRSCNSGSRCTNLCNAIESESTHFADVTCGK
jgi:hypothetical protein